MGGIRDWTSEGVLLNGVTPISNIQYRIDRDGVVRWRGLWVKINPVNTGDLIHFPEEADLNYPAVTYFDWTGALNANLNTYVSVSAFALGIYNAPGHVHDMSKFAWQGIPLPDPFSEHTLENVLAGIEAAMGELPGIRVYGYPADRIEAPAVVLSLPEVTDATFNGGSFDFEMPVWLFISRANDRAAAKEIGQYLDPRSPVSIQAAIEADRTLGGACDSVAVTVARPQIASVAGQDYLAIEYTLEVIG